MSPVSPSSPSVWGTGVALAWGTGVVLAKVRARAARRKLVRFIFILLRLCSWCKCGTVVRVVQIPRLGDVSENE